MTYPTRAVSSFTAPGPLGQPPIEIPEAHDEEFYAVKNVPHGQLIQNLYFSKKHQCHTPLLRLHSAGLR